MEGFPLLPGYAINNRCKESYTLPHQFEWKNGYRIGKKPQLGIGGEPLDVNSVLYCRTTDPTRYDPSLTYGRTKSYVPGKFRPNFVLYDKKCLTFRAFFKQSVVESPDEYYRVRKVNIIYFLEDDTITVMEPPVLNAGFPQGRLVTRCKVVKDDSGRFWHWTDLNVGIDIPIYGIVYHIVSCDLYTKEYLMSQGVDINPEEEMPEDPYTFKRQQRIRSGPSPGPAEHDKLRKFLEYDRKVLRFNAMWDNRDTELGEMEPYIIHYFLADDRIEVCEVKRPNSGKDPFSLLISKMKIPKNWQTLPVDYPACYLERTDDEVMEYYQPKDFIIGHTVFILGRRFLIYDCDQFTRNYYSTCLNIEQGEPLTFDTVPKYVPLPQPLPPYHGLGTVEDSLASWLHYNPRTPKKDVIRYLHNMNKTLRFKAIMDYIHPEDSDRDFIIQYHLYDGTILINELRKRNSGFAGGRFLKPTLLPKPDTDPANPEYYSPVDLYIGATVHVYGHRFKIYGADLAVYRYMEANPEKFKPEMLAELRKHLVREGLLTDNIQDIADFRQREEIDEPLIETQKPLPIVNALDIIDHSHPLENKVCFVKQVGNPNIKEENRPKNQQI